MQFLSATWVAALDDAAAAVSVDPEVDLTIEYRSGDFAYRLVIGGGRVRATTDLIGDADLRITADPSVAAGINEGTESALAGFMQGQVVVGGSIDKAIAHQSLLEELGSALAAHLPPD
ncbi:MAG TPA: SCP2 sterol-binding domain-containing protein [Acidimicrobiales bacterium]|nr:SCP2 sterol-binding domain-containing protein [Acidimicrobiales bacterium]